MMIRAVLFILFCSAICLGQGLPDRDELVAQLLKPESSDHAAAELIKHFQMGGVRTLIRNLNGLSPEQRLKFGMGLRHMDLFRFRNDLNANLQEAKDEESKSLYLMLMSTFGQQIADEVFDPYINDETQGLQLRLAAAGGTIKLQKPKSYDRFLALAKDAEVDPETGRNDFYFADLSKKNIGFFLYTRAKLSEKTTPEGAILALIQMAESGDTDVYQAILDMKKKKYLPLLLDRAIRTGGTDLLDFMGGHKTAKKLSQEIAAAKRAASIVADYRDKFMDRQDPELAPLGAFAPCLGTGQSVGGRAAFAIARISAEGEISVLAYETPFGPGNDNLKQLLSGRTTPSFVNFMPVESYIFAMAP